MIKFEQELERHFRAVVTQQNERYFELKAMELLGKYYEEGDCLSKAMAEMLLKSLNKDIKDFRVSPSFAKGRDLKDTNFTDREFLKKTAVDSIVRSRTENSNIAKSSSTHSGGISHRRILLFVVISCCLEEG